MTRKDLLVSGLLAAALLAFLSPVWARVQPAFFNHGDLYAYHWPLRHHTAASLIQGRLPFWNPYVLLGVPHAANPQAVLYYPPAILGFLLPAMTALAWDQILHLLWAGLGAFLLARAARAPRAAAAYLAAAYALSPFLVFRVTAGIPTLLAALAWAPWAWLAWLSGSIPLLAATWALQFLSGHPQFLVINAAGMALWAAPRPSRLVLWGRMAAGACGSMLLAAAQWPLTLELLRGSNRSGWPAEFSASYSLEPRALWTWLLPGSLGTPLDGHWAGPASVFYESAGVWLGFGALLLAALGLARGRRAALAAAALIAAGLVLALGANGPAASLLTVPALSYLRTPSRWSFLCLWGLWLLAGSGASWLLANERGRRAALGLLPLLALPLLARDSRFLRYEDPEPYVSAKTAMMARYAGTPVRVATDPELANPNKTIVYRARNANGYDAFYPATAARWAMEAEGRPAADSSRVLVSRWRSPAAERAGVRAGISPLGVAENPGAWPLAAFVDRAGRRVKPDPSLDVERPERWRVSGPAPAGAAAMILAEQRWPGWSASLNGSPVPLKDWGPAFQLVELPSGASSVDLRFEFAPAGWAWLAALSAAAWAAWLAYAARGAEAA